MPSPSSLDNRYVLFGGHIVSGDDLSLIAPGYLVVEDGLITDVGPGTPPPGLSSLDISGRIVVPGFINCHTHLGDAALKETGFGSPADVNLLWEPDGLRHIKMAELSRAELIAGMRRAVRQMISTGTVAFADFREGGVAGVLALREACRDLPIHPIIFGRHARFPLHSEAEFAENTVGLTDDQLAEISAILEIADGFSPVWANETTDRGLVQTAHLVRASGSRLATHACETASYRDLSLARTGTSDVSRVVKFLEPDFVAHLTAATEAEIEQIVQANIPVAMCPRSHAALGNGLPPFALATSKGAVIGLGTDNVMICSPDLVAELEFLGRMTRALTRDPAVLDARKILSSITVDAARVLDIDDRYGSLTPGRSASMVLFDLATLNLAGSLDPLASLVQRATAADIQAVIIDGLLAHGTI